MAAINASETARVIAALNQTHPARAFLRETFASEIVLSDTKTISMDTFQGGRRVAPVVHPNNPVKVGTRGTITEDAIVPGYLKPARKLTPDDLDKRLPGEVSLQPMSRTERLDRLRVLDFADMRDENSRWEEWVLAQQLTTGAVSVTGDGMDVTITLPLLADHNIAAAALEGGAGWNGANANGLFDFLTAQRLIGKNASLRGNVAIIGSRAWTDFLAQTTVQALVDKRFIDPNGTIAFGNGEIAVNDHGSVGGLRLFTYDEFYEDTSGNLQPMIPQDVCVVASTAMRVVRAFGRIASLRQTAPAQEWAHEWTEENPEAHYMALESAPLPYVQQVNGYVILNTR